MEAAVGALIAVVGTLLGSVTTYLLQRRTVAEQATSQRRQQLREERLAACSAFAGALTELKRAVIALWFRRHAPVPSEEARAWAWEDADRLGAAAEAARFRMLIVLDDMALADLADAAFASIDDIKRASEREDLIPAEKRFAEAVNSFVAAASRALR